MTKDEFAKIPFSFSSHVSMAHEHTTTYVNQQYGFVMVTRTKAYDEGMRFGKTRREFIYEGKCYKKLEKFLQAIKDVEFKKERK